MSNYISAINLLWCALSNHISGNLDISSCVIVVDKRPEGIRDHRLFFLKRP